MGTPKNKPIGGKLQQLQGTTSHSVQEQERKQPARSAGAAPDCPRAPALPPASGDCRPREGFAQRRLWQRQAYPHPPSSQAAPEGASRAELCPPRNLQRKSKIIMLLVTAGQHNACLSRRWENSFKKQVLQSKANRTPAGGAGRRCRSGLWTSDTELQAESPPQPSSEAGLCC